jgi:glycosyltransferase involved in cell wall biosynthesis
LEGIPDMKICFIARGLTKGGVYRFIKNVLAEINKLHSEEHEFYLIHNDSRFHNSFSNLNEIFIKTNNKLLFDYYLSVAKIVRYRFDVIIYPKNVIPLIHFVLKGKKINIIHDLGYFESGLNAYPFFDTLFMKAFMKISCKLSNKILAVSESTKKDIQSRFKINHNKIEVVYEGVEDAFRLIENDKQIDKTLNKFDIKRPFLFYSGSLSPRKNLVRTLEAFNEIKEYVPHNLIMTGLISWKAKEINNFINMQLKDRVQILGYVDEEDLINLYNSADIYLYPSLFEGFGLPILEAQACGCPVITSNVTSMPEVSGGGALLVNPLKKEKIMSAILTILEDPILREQLINIGKQNIRNYSWHTCTKRLFESIDKVNFQYAKKDNI